MTEKTYEEFEDSIDWDGIDGLDRVDLMWHAYVQGCHESAVEIVRLQAEIDRLTLTWSDDKPKEPGQYWIRERGASDPWVVSAVVNGAGEIVVSGWGYVLGSSDVYQHAGPIPKPGAPNE